MTSDERARVLHSLLAVWLSLKEQQEVENAKEVLDVLMANVARFKGWEPKTEE